VGRRDVNADWLRAMSVMGDRAPGQAKCVFGDLAIVRGESKGIQGHSRRFTRLNL
jgi:hypothetical protein